MWRAWVRIEGTDFARVASSTGGTSWSPAVFREHVVHGQHLLGSRGMSPIPESAVVTSFWGLPDLAFRRPSQKPRVEVWNLLSCNPGPPNGSL